MFKYSLLLLVCSAFFCQASPTNQVGTSDKNETANPTNQPTDKQPVAAPASPIIPLKTNETAKVDGSTTKPDSSPSSTNVVDPGQNKGDPNITTTTPITTSVKPEPTSKPPAPKPSSSSVPPPSSSSSVAPSSSSSPVPPHTTSTTTKPTSAIPPPAPPTPKPSPDGGFNLISFLGGMILGLGLLAIGYVVFKFYQTRRDSSYRTL